MLGSGTAGSGTAGSGTAGNALALAAGAACARADGLRPHSAKHNADTHPISSSQSEDSRCVSRLARGFI
jgi:hypothetical protein